MFPNVGCLRYAAAEDVVFKRALSEMSPYDAFTTFFSDLSIAEWYGGPSVIDTYERVVKEWSGNYKYFTEFVMALNHKSWEWHARKRVDLSELYAELYRKADGLVMKKFSPKEQEYYFRVTD